MTNTNVSVPLKANNLLLVEDCDPKMVVLGNIQQKRIKANELQTKLDRAMLLQSVIPDAFSKGGCSTGVLTKHMPGPQHGGQHPYQFFIHIGGDQRYLPFETFLKLEGHKFTEGQLQLIQKNWSIPTGAKQ